MSRRIALDIDGVLADFTGGVITLAREMGLAGVPASKDEVTGWMLGPWFQAAWEEVNRRNDASDYTFWLGLEPLRGKLQFRPHAYITNRPIPSYITEEWLRRNEFPDAPVFTVTDSKVPAMWDANCNILVDDRPENFADVNAAAHLICYLYDAPYNRDVPDHGLRIKRLEEVA